MEHPAADITPARASSRCARSLSWVVAALLTVTCAPHFTAASRGPPADEKPLTGPARHAKTSKPSDDMKCAGNHEASRACLFKDLYYDRDTRTFAFFGKVDGQVSDADAPELFARETCASSLTPVLAHSHHSSPPPSCRR